MQRKRTLANTHLPHWAPAIGFVAMQSEAASSAACADGRGERAVRCGSASLSAPPSTEEVTTTLFCEAVPSCPLIAAPLPIMAEQDEIICA